MIIHDLAIRNQKRSPPHENPSTFATRASASIFNPQIPQHRSIHVRLRPRRQGRTQRGWQAGRYVVDEENRPIERPPNPWLVPRVNPSDRRIGRNLERKRLRHSVVVSWKYPYGGTALGSSPRKPFLDT